MSALKDAIVVDMKTAMKERDKPRLAAIRLITAAIKQVEVDQRIEAGDSDVLSVLDKMVKQRRQSIEEFEKAGRDDLVAKERAELEVIAHYLPDPLSDGEIASLVQQALADTQAASMADMGRVMAWLRPHVQGRIDMQQLSQLVRSALN